MDNDISHAVQEQLDALSARLDALENPTEINPEPPDGEDGEEEVEPEPSVEY